MLPSILESTSLAQRTDRTGNGIVRLSGFHLEDEDGQMIAAARSGMDVTFVFTYECTDALQAKNVDVGLSVHSSVNDMSLFVLYRSYCNMLFKSLPSRGTFRCRIPRLPLAAGRYRIGVRVVVNGTESDRPQNGVGYIDVESGDFYGSGQKGFGGRSPFLVDGTWDVQEN